MQLTGDRLRRELNSWRQNVATAPGHAACPLRMPPFPAVTRDSIAPSVSHALAVPVSPALRALSSVLQLLAPHSISATSSGPCLHNPLGRSHCQLCLLHPWPGSLEPLLFPFTFPYLQLEVCWQLNSAFHNGLILLSSTCFFLKWKKFNWFQGDHIILVF